MMMLRAGLVFVAYLQLAEGNRRNRQSSAAVASTGNFNFDYNRHGEDWVQGSCSSRARQSPIDFEDYNSPASGKLSYQYQTVKGEFDIQSNGHSISASLAGQGYGGVTYENAFWNLMNINFHALSEHTFRGMHKPIEIHLVHKRSDSDALLVVAVPVESPTPIGGVGGGIGNKGGGVFLERSNSSAPVVARAVQGETFGAGSYVSTGRNAAPAPGPQITNKVAAGPYKAPNPDLPSHNPTIQSFLRLPPPNPGEIVKAEVSELNPMDINQFLQGGTFMEYAGSLTAPPCSEIVTWFVRRDALMASDEQVLILHDELYRITTAFGNYRTTMPLNNRPIAIRQAVKEEPPLKAPEMAIPLGPNPRTDREFRAMKWAKDALAIAQHSQSYIRDLDTRLRNAAIAHANALAPDLMPEHVKQGLPPPDATEAGVEPIDMAKTAESMAKSIATAAKEAIADATRQISIEAKAAAAVAAKEATKMAGGAMPALPGAPGAAPAAAR
jgi:carbonic anhydrase